MSTPYRIETDASSRPLRSANTAFRTVEDGEAHLYCVDAGQDTFIMASYVKWVSGRSEVRVELSESRLTSIARLEHGLRLAIETVLYDGHYYDCVALRLAKLQDEEEKWSNLFDAARSEVDRAAGFPAIDHLMSLGAQHIVKGHEIPAKASRRTRREFLLFPKHDHTVPLNAFAITRLLPLLNRIRATNQIKLF